MPRNATKLKTKLKKKKLKTRSRSKKPGRVSRLPLILISLGIILLSYWGTHKFLYFRALSLSRSQVAQIVREQPQKLPLPVHIFIPWNTDADIEPLSFLGDQWQISDTKVAYLLDSARPGTLGNIILYGHNKREILGNIRALTGGEKITLTTADGRQHIYYVKTAKEVEATNVAALSPTTKETLTLFTCSGFWDSQRFIVQATP